MADIKMIHIFQYPIYHQYYHPQIYASFIGSLFTIISQFCLFYFLQIQIINCQIQQIRPINNKKIPLQSAVTTMRNQQHLSPFRVGGKGEKFVYGSPISGSTSEASDYRLKSLSPNPYSIKTFSPLQSPKSIQSEVVSQLRNQLKSIKSSVSKLMQEDFIKKPSNLQMPQPIQSSKKFSKIFENAPKTEEIYYLQSKRIEAESRYVNNVIDQLQNIRQDHQRLKIICKLKEEKQAEFNLKYKKLTQELNVLQKYKQQLIKCIQTLKIELKEVTDELKQYKFLNTQQEEKIRQILENQNNDKQTIMELNKNYERLQEQLQFQKAQNKELIKIIQFTDNQLQKLNGKLLENERIIKNLEDEKNQILHTNRMLENLYQNNFHRKPIYIEPKDHILNELQSQNNSLNRQLAQKQKIMLMMLKDIKQMDRELKIFDIQHEQLIKYKNLIEKLNQQTIKFECIKLNSKYKYY